MGDFDRQSLARFADVLPPRDLSLLVALGEVLELSALTPAGALELISETRRRASKRIAETAFALEVGDPP